MPARIVFFGTPTFALPTLTTLVNSPEYDLIAVVTQPDKPAGRGQELTPPPVKSLATERHIPVFQPKSLRGLQRAADGKLVGDSETAPLADLLSSAPIDAFVVVAYGKLIVPALLDLPRTGIINVHASLLPRWRGACPIQWALFSGDTETGVCLMRIEQGLDTGGVFSRQAIPITDEDTTGSLFEKLASLGAELVARDLPQILSGALAAIPQPSAGVTYAEKWERSHAEIPWPDPAETTVRRIRCCAPTPGARTTFEGELFKIFRARTATDSTLPPAAPGTIVEVNRSEVIVATGNHTHLSLEEVQLAGKKRLLIREALCSGKFAVGKQFGAPPDCKTPAIRSET